jgi:phage terminase large subunit-like protein
MQRAVVAIDPSGSGGQEADECGIVAVGVDEDGEAWVLADDSGRYQPTEWAGQMVEATIRAIDLNVAYRAVQASRGKVARAEPVAALYEKGRVHHLGAFPELEDQMCAFTSAFDRARAGFSPGRVDALVWALTDLVLQPMASWGFYELTRRRALGLPVGKSKAAAPIGPVEKPYCARGSVEWTQQQKRGT